MRITKAGKRNKQDLSIQHQGGYTIHEYDQINNAGLYAPDHDSRAMLAIWGGPWAHTAEAGELRAALGKYLELLKGGSS